ASRSTLSWPRRTPSRCRSPTPAPGSARSAAGRSSSCSPGGPATPVPGSASRLRGRSSRPTGSASGWRTHRAAGPCSASRCQWRRRFPRSRRLPQILVIDDDPGLLSVCTVGLRAFGHQVLTAETGNDGISQAAVAGPDIIVLDLGLSDLDGLDVCRRIRAWSDVPIIVLSADGTESRKVDALDHGADDYMT